MNKRFALGLSVILLASAGIASNASAAQEKTRAEVRQELIQAENNGLNYVSNTSYPEVSPIFAQQVTRLKQQSESSAGTDMSTSSAAGTSRAHMAMSSCVGPVSFCNPYFGG